jgi:glycosyltransferase involved in cell wall biosynthesis
MLTSSAPNDSLRRATGARETLATGPMVSVILVCRCEAEHIRSVIGSILDQEEPEGGIEIVVADGMSEDGTKEILTEMAATEPRLKVIENPARITSAGLNAAIRKARGQVIVRMDAHTHYAPDYVRQCLELLQKTGADNVGGPWVAQAHGYLGEAIAAAFQSRFAVGGARGHVPRYEGAVDTVYLGCWRKETFERFGNFDENLVRNQDDEHNLRILRGGGRIWQSPKIRSWYQSRTSIKGLFDQYMQYGYWKVQVIRKHKLPASVRHLVPGAFLLSLILLVLAWDISLLTLPFVSPGSAVHNVLVLTRKSATIGLAGIVLSYVAALLLASIQAAFRTQWKLFPVLPVVFCCYHLGYGWGFLRGVLDFAVFHRGASAVFTRLTRPSGVDGSMDSLERS